LIIFILLFLGHNFWSTDPNRPWKPSKNLCCNLVSQQSLKEKLLNKVGAQPPMVSSKKTKSYPFMTSPTKKQISQTFQFCCNLNYNTSRILRRFEQLFSFCARRGMMVQTCANSTKKWRPRKRIVSFQKYYIYCIYWISFFFSLTNFHNLMEILLALPSNHLCVWSTHMCWNIKKTWAVRLKL